MKQTMKPLPEQMLRDEAEMRAFYQSMGIRPEITELAIRARRNWPMQEEKKADPKRIRDLAVMAFTT